METLLMHLAELGVVQVWLESRTSSLNNMARQHLGSMRNQQLIPKSLRVDVEKPLVEPMLWMPDIVAGAVGAARHGNPVYLDLMQQTVTELEIQLD